MAIGEAIARKGIQKMYWLETRADVLLRNKEVFQFWAKIGLKTMFIGLEAVDEEGLKKFRKRVSQSKNFEALEFARSLGVNVAINIIADPDWDREQFRVIRDWCSEIPEVVNVSVNTPYPGTETWHTESRRLISRDYRLFDIQHVVLPTKLPLEDFYGELVATQQVLNRKHLGMKQVWGAAKNVAKLLAHGQTNFLRMLFAFNSVYDPKLQMADHAQPVVYEMPLPPAPKTKVDPAALYVHPARGRHGREIDDSTEVFVDQTRMGAATSPAGS
jgi:hopanoid C-3 methylase HpnR